MRLFILGLLTLSQSVYALDFNMRNSVNLGLRFGIEKEQENPVDERETTTNFIVGSRTSFLESKVDLGETIFTFLAIGVNYQFDNNATEFSVSPISLHSKDIGTSISLDIYKHDDNYQNVGLSVGFSF